MSILHHKYIIYNHSKPDISWDGAQWLQSIPFDLTQANKITRVHTDNIKSVGFKNS